MTLAEDRAAAVVRLPAFRKPAQGQRQRLRRQIVDADPRQHEKAAVRHRKVQAAAAVSLAPADPFVPRRQLPRRRLEQQNGQRPPAPVADEPADVRAEGPRTAEIMIAVHERFPQGGVLRRRRLLQGQGLQGRETAGDLRLRVGRPHMDNRPGRLFRGRAALLRQGQDPALLKALENTQARRDAVFTFRRCPAQVLADGLRQLVAAVVREHRDGLCDVGDLAPCETPAEKSGGLEGLDSRVHGCAPGGTV